MVYACLLSPVFTTEQRLFAMDKQCYLLWNCETSFACLVFMKTEVKNTPAVSISLFSPRLLALRLIYSFEDLNACALLQLDTINFIADISSCLRIDIFIQLLFRVSRSLHHLIPTN